MNPTIPSPVRIQCQVADRSSSERTAESERPKSLGDRLFQKLTNATPITSIPPASKPRATQASIISTDTRTDRPRASVIRDYSGRQAKDDLSHPGRITVLVVPHRLAFWTAASRPNHIPPESCGTLHSKLSKHISI